MLQAITRCAGGEPLQMFAASWGNRGFGGRLMVRLKSALWAVSLAAVVAVVVSHLCG